VQWLKRLVGLHRPAKAVPPAVTDSGGLGRALEQRACARCGHVLLSTLDSLCPTCLASLPYRHHTECRVTRNRGGRAGIEVVAIYSWAETAGDSDTVSVSGRTDEDGIVVLELTGHGARPTWVTYRVDDRLTDGPHFLRPDELKASRGWVV
jgi:hypothetical protein